MIEGWITDEIDNLCNVEYGTRVVQKKDGGTIYPVYGGGDATFSIDVHNREDRLTIARFAMSAKCTRFVKGKFFLNDSGLTLSPKDKSQIEQEFLNYQCLAMNDIFYSLAKGSAQKNLDVPAFRKLMLNIPKDIKMQRKIVEKLDAIFAEIDKATAAAEANAKNAEALFQSYLTEVFECSEEGWNDIKFGDIADFRNGINFLKSERGVAVKILGVKNFQSNFTAPINDLDTVSLDEMVNDDDLVKNDDIIFVRSNGNPELIGRCILIEHLVEKVTFSGFTIRARLNVKNIYSKFLCFALKSAKVRRIMIDGGNGANIKSLNQTTLSNLMLRIPSSFDKQVGIVKNIQNIEYQVNYLKALYLSKLNALSMYKQSILNQAFSGELVKE